MVDPAAHLDPPDGVEVVVSGDAWSRGSRWQWNWATWPGFRFR
ncbi:MAG TPA: hypothetical protein VJ735_04965 [Actinomycetes bacterium]|nr:hypothetical protein [Actinomycetes bacterium]